MELKSSIEERVVKMPMLMILLTKKDRDSLIKLLKAIPRKMKMDRLDEYMINNLVEALENPKVDDEPDIYSEKDGISLSASAKFPEEKKENDVKSYPDKSLVIDKVKVITELKGKLDPEGKKSINDFIKESVDYGQTQMGIKTVPKANTIEAFYEWLVDNNVMDVNGSPVPKR